MTSHPQPRFDAVLFDMDGVLVDSEPWWDEVRIEFAREHGSPWTADDQAAVMGGNSREWAETMRDRLSIDHLSAGEIQRAIVTAVVRCYQTRPVPVIGDAPAQVRRIAASWPVAIVSSAHRDVIEAALDALGLRSTMHVVVSSDDVPRGKPEPDVYLLAAAQLGVDPERCLVVEDSLNGVRAGKAAGMTVVLVPNSSVPPGPGARDLADVVMAALADLDPGALPAGPGVVPGGQPPG